MSLSIRVNVTVPKEILNVASVRGEIEAALRNRTSPEIKNMFQLTIRGWSNGSGRFGPVNFLQKFHFGPRVLKAQILTYSKKYGLVNAGAPRHSISVRRRKLLSFRSGYRAATQPRVIGSSGAVRFGEVWVAKVVNHPGFKGREFDDEIAEQYRPIFEKDMQEAINRGAR